jgi:4-amino-4-deoxy-L-arabinose transferase-like glycosyltransferase
MPKMTSEVAPELNTPSRSSLVRPWQAAVSEVRAHLFPPVLGVAGFGVLGLHLYGLTSSPPGFYVDEGSIAYDAYALTVDGRDEFGQSWPLFFQSFGDYKSPAIVYLIAGMMRLFGPSVGIARLVPSLLGLVTAVGLGWLAYQIFRNRWLGVATFVVTGTVPWLFIISRIAFEPATLPPALALFLLAWWYADREGSGPRRQLLMAVLAGLSVGAVIYSYTTGRLLGLILVAVLCMAYLGRWRRRWLPLMVTSLTALASYLPMLVWSSQNPGKLTARFDQLSIFCRPVSTCSPLPEIVGNADDVRFFPAVVAERFLRVYLAAWNPTFLFYTGDPYGRHVTGHGGMLYVALAPFLIVGAVALLRHWREPFWRLIGLGVVFGGIPAALTMHLGHASRTIDLVPLLIIVMALGAAELIRLLPGQRWIAVALGFGLLVETVGFMADYFSAYPIRQAFYFDPGLETAIATALRTPHNGPIVLSDHIDRPEIMFAFFSREDPKAYRARGIAGGSAVVESVTEKLLPPGSVVIAKPGEKVMYATLLQTVSSTGKDRWGHPAKPDDYYSVWFTR